MTIQKPRKRLISVRFSDEEYSALKQFCLLTGARSLSDLTRNAVRDLLDGSKRDSVPERVNEFETGGVRV
jgi:hypothetical protein